MSSATAISNDSERTEERRSSPRETLEHYVVLVFFGEDNWGKLTNMSESGMAFEFAKPPSLQERVNFTFQAMGCMPMPRHGKGLGESFEAWGKIVWTREFERGAGVQFMNLAEASRGQIREWLSLEASPNTSRPEARPLLAELLARFGPESGSERAADKKASLRELDRPVPLAEAVPEPDPAFLESSVAEESYDAPTRSGRGHAAEGQQVPEWPAASHPSVARLTFLVVSGCLAAFAVTAGVRIYMTRAAQPEDAAVRASVPAPGMSEPTAAVNAPSPVPTPVAWPAGSATSSSSTSSPVAGTPPFQVNVLDASGRNWILWFDSGGGGKDQDNHLPYRLAQPFDSSTPTMRGTKRQEAIAPQKPPVARTFAMVAPNVSHALNSRSSGSSPAEVPAIQPELGPSLGGPMGGALGSQAAPAAPAVRAPTGGMVQQPALIRSAPLVYPELAKSSRVSGDVLVDALIDAAGNVTTVKVISGPVLLQQGAIETVRQWKYRPALLDGQAVAMHLTVTVRFRLNSNLSKASSSMFSR